MSLHPSAHSLSAFVLAAVVGLGACKSPTSPQPDTKPWTPGTTLIPASASKPIAVESAGPRKRNGTEIVIAGELVPIGVPVVLWSDPGGYNAYGRTRERESFTPGRPTSPGPLSGRDRVPRSRTPEVVRQAVDQFVLHYDVCGVSRECFKVLEARGLSVHFLLDIDGTLYQTLDLAESAWHAREANGRSIGVEIANIGAYPAGSTELATWYGRDGRGTRITVPPFLRGGGVRTAGFIGRPARAHKLRGRINGQTLEQYDFTPQQYETLAHLTAALVNSFPNMPLRFPTDGSGGIRPDVLSKAEFERYRGILGHQHVSSGKTDPGPSFNWSALSRRARQLLGAP